MTVFCSFQVISEGKGEGDRGVRRKGGREGDNQAAYLLLFVFVHNE